MTSGPLSRQFDFDGVTLAEAVRLTFERRGTGLPPAIEAFTESFIQSKETQWAAFRKRLKDDRAPARFKDVVAQVDRFLTPVFKTLSSGKSPGTWKAPGPWN